MCAVSVLYVVFGVLRLVGDLVRVVLCGVCAACYSLCVVSCVVCALCVVRCVCCVLCDVCVVSRAWCCAICVVRCLIRVT